MKKTAIIILLIVTAISCNRIKKEERILVKAENDTVLVINTPSAKCHKCQTIIESGLQEIEGVSQSILDLNKKQVSIVYNPENITSEKLNKTVEHLTEKTPCK